MDSVPQAQFNEGDMVALISRQILPYRLVKQKFFVLESMPPKNCLPYPPGKEPRWATIVPCSKDGVVKDYNDKTLVGLEMLHPDLHIPSNRTADQRNAELLHFFLTSYAPDVSDLQVKVSSLSPPLSL